VSLFSVTAENPQFSRSKNPVMVRALIVDDEPLARQRLRTLLKGEPDIEVVGECSNGH